MCKTRRVRYSIIPTSTDDVRGGYREARRGTGFALYGSGAALAYHLLLTYCIQPRSLKSVPKSAYGKFSPLIMSLSFPIYVKELVKHHNVRKNPIRLPMSFSPPIPNLRGTRAVIGGWVCLGHTACKTGQLATISITGQR